MLWHNQFKNHIKNVFNMISHTHIGKIKEKRSLMLTELEDYS